MRHIKKTDLVTKIVGVVLLLAIFAYFAFYMLSSLKTPFQTVSAVDYTVRDTISVYGIVVRDEQTLLTNYSSVYISADEGKRVSGGGIVGSVYRSDSELASAERVREINRQIASLEAIKEGGAEDDKRIENNIKSEIQAIRSAATERELTEISVYSSNIKALAFSTAGDGVDIDGQISSLRSEANRLQHGAAQAYDVIRAPSSGLFSTALDGFEDIGPKTIRNLDVAGLKNIMGSDRETPSGAIGKLVYSNKWYYAAMMSEEEARTFREGRRVTMIFGRYYSEYLTMRVESISDSDDGNCAVVFSCSESMADILSMRMQSAEIILGEDSGVRVPKKAARVDDKGAYVFVQTGMQAEKKYIEIKYDIGDYYVVESETLHKGDVLIVSGRDLYDGKVLG